MEKESEFKKKKKKLINLKDEVNEFHPLLLSLLPTLPEILDVEYNHGPHEKGADFIITRIDSTLNRTEYVGVIAKTGKITGALIPIYEQIDDCNLPRVIQNGKKKIHLNEIWVITNDSISNSAQEKIHNKYGTSKINFLQNKDLIKFIDKYLNHFWSDQILPVGDYLKDITRKMEEQNTAQSLIPNNSGNMNVDLNLIQIESDFKKKRNNSRKYNLIDLIQKQKIIIIEGGPGSGKSHLIRKSIIELASIDNFSKHNYIPIYTPYTDLCKNNEANIANLLDEPAYSGVKNKMESDTSIVLFIDSFDEHIVDNRDIYKEVRALISQSETIVNLHLVISTRPLSTIDYNEIIPHMPTYEIEQLSMTQVIEFFMKICSKVKVSSRLIEDIKNSELFKQMPRNPISAIMLAQIINDNDQDLPSNLTDVYSKYSELMLGKWDKDKGLISNQEFATSVSIITEIAKFFIENDLTHMAKSEVQGIFHKYFSARNISIDPDELFEKVTRQIRNHSIRL
ncbi:NTPase [Candidatus Scalindua japonica]|uniref:NTPase n=1 Tax=Candidatus Scalindua japonica TaxID=1284222 RepID=A0A286TYK6_9BACT|nr:NACHT domain-containing protein [Candidatus Scalindua japonica]GAX60967.1 NTPase [Candidatus Scalindua japonica]